MSKKIIIIDDEPLAREVIKEYLETYSSVDVVAECNNGFEGLKAIQEHQPDLIFLDIQMPKINGFELLELTDQLPAIIFTTAYDEYAIRAFEANALDYLLKPFSKERFDKAMQRWLEKKEESVVNAVNQQALAAASQYPMQNNRIVVKTGGKIKIIPLQQVQYLEAADDYVKIVTPEGSYLKNKTMQFFENFLDSQVFVRVHRSYIINISQVTRLEPYEKENYIVILLSGKQIPVSKGGYGKLKSVLGI
jgi:two-component system, LytTR family, response regulator